MYAATSISRACPHAPLVHVRMRNAGRSGLTARHTGLCGVGFGVLRLGLTEDELGTFERTGGEAQIEALAVLVRPSRADLRPGGLVVAVPHHAVDAVRGADFGCRV